MLNKIISYLSQLTLPAYIPNSWSGLLTWFSKNISGLRPLQTRAGIEAQDFELYEGTYKTILYITKAIELCETLLAELKQLRLDILAGNLGSANAPASTELVEYLQKINSPVCHLIDTAKEYRDLVDAMPLRTEADLDACGYIVHPSPAPDPGSVQSHVTKHFDGNLVSLYCTCPAPGFLIDVSCDYHDGEGVQHLMVTKRARIIDSRQAPAEKDETRTYTVRLLDKQNNPIGLITTVTMTVRQGMKF